MPGSPVPPPPAPATSRAPPAPRPGGQRAHEAGRGAGGRRTHGQVQLDGVHGLVEGPGELVLPQRLDHHVLHVLQLVGLAAGLGGVGHLGRGRVHGARGHRHPRGGGRRRGGHRPAAACSRAGAAAAQGGPRFLPAEARHPISRPDQAAPRGGGAAEEGGHPPQALPPARPGHRRQLPAHTAPSGLAARPAHATLTCHGTPRPGLGGAPRHGWQKATGARATRAGGAQGRGGGGCRAVGAQHRLSSRPTAAGLTPHRSTGQSAGLTDRGATHRSGATSPQSRAWQADPPGGQPPSEPGSTVTARTAVGL